MFKAWRYLMTFAAVSLLTTTPHAGATEKAPSPMLYSHQEFIQLSTEQRVAYIKMIVGVLAEVEQSQSGHMSAQLLPNWSRWLLEEAEAKTVFAQGTPCVFAGGISSYGGKARLTCQNNQPCQKDPNQIICNPLLFGEGVCTSASDGATARCMRSQAVSDATLVQNLAKAENAKKWNQFKKEFDGFCGDVLTDSKDFNYKSCKLIEKRVRALEKDLKLPPAAPPVAAQEPAPVAPVAAPKVTANACSSGESGTCQGRCPLQVMQSTRPMNEGDLKKTKYAQLLKIMSHACSVKNASDAKSGAEKIKSQSVGNLIDKFGACDDSDYPGVGKFSNENSIWIIDSLVRGDKLAHQDLSSGLWLNTNSEAMQDYFGLNIKDARLAFCTDSPEHSLQILRGLPEADFLTTGATRPSDKDLAELLKTAGPVEHLPNWASFSGGDGQQVTVQDINRFKVRYAQRKKLADCVARNLTNPGRGRVETTDVRPANCNLETYEVTEKRQLAALALNLSDEGRGLCITAKNANSPAIRCVSCDRSKSTCNCTAEFPDGGATVTSLKCAASAPLQGDRGAPVTPAPATK